MAICRKQRNLGIAFTVFFVFVFAQRLPAPIVEETPTPVPRESVGEKARPKPKPTAANESEKGSSRDHRTSQRNQSEPLFAGTWIGTGGWSQGLSVLVSPGQESVIVRGMKDVWGERRGDSTANGNTLSWNFLLEKWTMVLSKDGKTAVVTVHAWPVGVYSGTFRKVP